MADIVEGQVCGIDGCEPAAERTEPKRVAPLPPVLGLSIVSDAICPWCWVGKRRLEKALLTLGPAAQFRITWRPFELNPQMPKEGMERREYRLRKFGSLERSQAMDAQMTAAGAKEGISFRHDLITRTPNTFDAHRMIWLADREGVQDAFVEALFRAYFSQGRDIGNKAVLSEVVAEAGIDRAKAAAFLEGPEGAAEVRRDLSIVARAGLSGVPTFVLDGRVLFSGAQPPEIMASAIGQATGAYAG